MGLKTIPFQLPCSFVRPLFDADCLWRCVCTISEILIINLTSVTGINDRERERRRRVGVPKDRRRIGCVAYDNVGVIFIFIVPCY